MAGLYRRGVQRNMGNPRMQVQGSQGAGGAIPRGAGLPQQEKNNTSQRVQQLGGLLGMLNQQGAGGADPSGFGLLSGVPLVNDSAGSPAGDVLGGLANANNGMSYEPVQTGFMGLLQDGWGNIKDFFSFGGGAGA